MDGNAALLESWALSLHAKRPRTVAAYLRAMGWFAAWYGGDLTAVTKQDVERWILYERERGMKPNTIRARWIPLRAFYRWAEAEGEIDINPAAKVVVAKANEPAPAVVSQADFLRLLKTCEGTTFTLRRDYALVRMLRSTGVRVSELIGIQLGDLDLPNRLAAISDGKGGRSRVVRFDPATAAALDRYKRARARHRCATDPALWIGHRGRMTVKGVEKTLTTRSAQAGIPHVFPHRLRHTWADAWLAQGGEEGDLMRLGGWESTEIMRRYGSARATDRALGAYDKIDPMNGL